MYTKSFLLLAFFLQVGISFGFGMKYINAKPCRQTIVSSRPLSECLWVLRLLSVPQVEMEEDATAQLAWYNARIGHYSTVTY